jgi:hypothetical protein
MEDDSVELMESYYKENIPFTNKTPIKRPPPPSSATKPSSAVTGSADRRTVTPNTINKQQSTSNTTSSSAASSSSSSSLLLPPRPPSIKKLVKPPLPPPPLAAPAHHRYQTPKKPFKPPSRITPKSVSSSDGNAQTITSTDEKNMTVKSKSYYNSTFDRLKNRNNHIPVAVVTDEKKPFEGENVDNDETNDENSIPEEEKFDPIYQKPLPRRQYDSKLRKAFFR